MSADPAPVTPIVWDDTPALDVSVVHIPPVLAAAVVAAWADLGNVTKRRSADTGSYQYDYADLGDVLDTARPTLAAHDLALLQPVEREAGGPLRVGTWLVHASGAVLRFTFEATAGATPQAIGSSITYARRYCGTAALGIATEGADDDGRAASTPPSAPPRARHTTASRKASASTIAEAGPRRTAQAMALFGRLGLADRDDRLQVTSAILGRPVDSWSNTTPTEQLRVIAELIAREAEADDGRPWVLDHHDGDDERRADLEGEGRDRGGY